MTDTSQVIVDLRPEVAIVREEEGSASDVGHLDLRKVGRGRRAEVGIAVAAAAPDGFERGLELLVAGAVPDQGAQVVAPNREQAREKLPFRGEARAGAVAAEGLGDGGDHADLSGPVPVAPTPRDLAAVGRLDGLDPERLVEAGDDLPGPGHVLPAPPPSA